MKISVESGKRSPFAFENSKIKVEGSKGIYYNGQISITKDNKLIHEGGYISQNNNAKAIDSDVDISRSSSKAPNMTNESSNKLAAKKKASSSSLGIDKSKSKSMSSGQKLGISDLPISDGKFLLGMDLEFLMDKFEVDFSIFLLDEDGNSSEENFMFYGNKESKDSSVKIDDDHNLNISKAFDSIIAIDLNKVDKSVRRISLAGTLYDESNKFADLKKGVLSLISTSKDEVLTYEFTQKLTSENAIVICDFYLHNEKWKLQAIGQGFNGGLSALCSNFGVETL